jgi:hypothetical protein
VIAVGLERLDDARRLERAAGPDDVQAAIGVVEPRLGDAGQLLHRALDAADAGAAGDAVDRQIHAQPAVGVRRGVEREVEGGGHD